MTSEAGALEGHGVRLRPVLESDYHLIHRWMNHPEVWHYMDYEGPFSLVDVAEDAERSRREGYPFTIMAGERPVGRIGLNQFRRRDRICSLYMYIGEPAFWGKGFAQDAVMTLLGFAFDRWDLHRVELWTLSDNNRAMAVYRRCGFAQDATLPERSWKEGGWVDRVVMSVTREAFAPLLQAWRDGPEIA